MPPPAPLGTPLGATDRLYAHRRASPPAPAQPLAHAPAACWYTRIVTQERCCCARKGTRAALAALGLLGIAARTQRLISYARAHTPLSPPSALGLLGFAARAQRLFLVRGSHPLFRPAVSPYYSQRIAPRPLARTHARQCTDDRYLQRIAPRPHARTHAFTRTDDRRRTTCGPPAWLTGRRQDRGIRSVRSPLRRPLSPSLRPLSPCPCKAAALKGPAFCFLNY